MRSPARRASRWSSASATTPASSRTTSRRSARAGSGIRAAREPGARSARRSTRRALLASPMARRWFAAATGARRTARVVRTSTAGTCGSSSTVTSRAGAKASRTPWPTIPRSSRPWRHRRSDPSTPPRRRPLLSVRSTPRHRRRAAGEAIDPATYDYGAGCYRTGTPGRCGGAADRRSKSLRLSLLPQVARFAPPPAVPLPAARRPLPGFALRAGGRGTAGSQRGDAHDG